MILEVINYVALTTRANIGTPFRALSGTWTYVAMPVSSPAHPEVGGMGGGGGTSRSLEVSGWEL